MRIRSLGRSLGINRVLAKAVGGRKYEDRFGVALLAAIRSGDNVWDVGANVGLYTDRFLQAVGPAGRVVAFEPAEGCHRAIIDRFGDEPRLTALPLALGQECGFISMAMGGNELATTHRVIADGAAANGPTRNVRIVTGARICEGFSALLSTVINLDVGSQA